jgi:type I restriction enzyme M protein
MDADDFRDYMLSFLFLRYLSDNYETAAKKELGKDYPKLEGDGPRVPLALWYGNNPGDVAEFEKQMRRKVHYVIKPEYLWTSIANMARKQNGELPDTPEAGFKSSETTRLNESHVEEAALTLFLLRQGYGGQGGEPGDAVGHGPQLAPGEI